MYNVYRYIGCIIDQSIYPGNFKAYHGEKNEKWLFNLQAFVCSKK